VIRICFGTGQIYKKENSLSIKIDKKRETDSFGADNFLMAVFQRSRFRFDQHHLKK
jgi:hypothetical protein